MSRTALQSFTVQSTRCSAFATRILTEVRNRALLRPGERVLVALSGGPDSVALLSTLLELRRLVPLEHVRAFHLDHAMRAFSARDAQFCRALCTRLGVPLDVERVLVPRDRRWKRLGPEATARAVRYERLAAVARRARCGAVATGHHADDEAETVLLRLLRGTSVDGLAGLPHQRRLAKGIHLVRPLLGRIRTEILAYLRARELPFRTDPSNASPAFLRNRVRRLWPAFERAGGAGVRSSLARLAAWAREDTEALELWAARAHTSLARASHREQTLDRMGLLALPASIRARVLRRAYLEISGPPEALSRAHWDAARSVVAVGRGAVAWPGGVRIEGSRVSVVVRRRAGR